MIFSKASANPRESSRLGASSGGFHQQEIFPKLHPEVLHRPHSPDPKPFRIEWKAPEMVGFVRFFWGVWAVWSAKAAVLARLKQTWPCKHRLWHDSV